MNNWKQEFSRQFTDNVLPGGYGNDLTLTKEDVEPLMDFIQSLLDKQREELMELVEGMKQKLYPKDGRSDAQIEHELVMVTAYNQFADDLLTKLENK